jgi:hypothetical protein
MKWITIKEITKGSIKKRVSIFASLSLPTICPFLPQPSAPSFSKAHG